MGLRQPRRLFSRPRRRPAWPALFALVLGGTLVVMATPRLMAGLSVEPHDALFRALGKGRATDAEVILAAALDHEEALRWQADAETSADLATLYFVAASHFPSDSVLRQEFLQRAVAQNRQSLQRAPAQPYAWAQLALALTHLEGDSDAARAALVQSLRRAPWQPRLAELRAGMGLRHWSRLDEDTRALVLLQVRQAAELDPKGLAAVVPSPALWAVVEQALVDRPDLLLAMEAQRRGR
jgi:hypothetical protein